MAAWSGLVDRAPESRAERAALAQPNLYVDLPHVLRRPDVCWDQTPWADQKVDAWNDHWGKPLRKMICPTTCEQLPLVMRGSGLICFLINPHIPSGQRCQNSCNFPLAGLRVGTVLPRNSRGTFSSSFYFVTICPNLGTKSCTTKKRHG